MPNPISQSFETFVMQPLSILKKRIVNIISLKTNLVDEKSVSVEILRESLQINVVNSDKMYNLLSSVMYKKRMLEERKDKENAEKEIFAG